MHVGCGPVKHLTSFEGLPAVRRSAQRPLIRVNQAPRGRTWPGLAGAGHARFGMAGPALAIWPGLGPVIALPGFAPFSYIKEKADSFSLKRKESAFSLCAFSREGSAPTPFPFI